MKMNKVNLSALLLLLIGGVAIAAVYKWMDESGSIHYGDTPPPERDTQSVAVPEGPSQNEVERAQQQMREKIDQYKKYSEEARHLEPPNKPSQETDSHAVNLDNVVCFTPLSDLVLGLSAETFSPITPTILNNAQQEMLNKLFEKTEASWRGTITDLTCLGSSSQPRTQIRYHEIRTAVGEAIERSSHFMFKTESIGKESRRTEKLFQHYEIGDALYFIDVENPDLIAQDGNKVEVLSIHKNAVSFLIKRHVPTGSYTRRPRAELRHLETFDRKLKLIELYFHDGMLTGSRTWILTK